MTRSRKMPALRLFGRQWLISTDDLPLPMAGLMLVHTLWCVLILVVYERAHRTLEKGCSAGDDVLAWLFGTFTCYFLCLCVEAIILHMALRGRIMEPGKRKYVPYVMYVHVALICADIGFTIYGTVLDAGASAECLTRSRTRAAVLCIIIGNYIVIACNFIGFSMMFSMFGHLPSEQKWYKIFDVIALMMCLKRRKSSHSDEVDRQIVEHGGGLGHIANCFAEVFQGADLVPSDIAAGLGLLAIQHRHLIEGSPLGKPLIENADAFAPYLTLQAMYDDFAHYARWALAAYGWALYTWAHPTKGLGIACSSVGCMECCGCGSCTKKANERDSDTLDRTALKKCAGIASEDLFYVSVANGVGEPPYFIARDVRRRAVVLSIRGTLSIADCITDSMYKPVMLSAEAVHEPQMSGHELHVHSGVLRATNFILADLETNRVLEQAILGEAPRDGCAPIPSSASECKNWDLVITGHSLGAGVAAVLSLHLRKKFPRLKVWCIEPPGGVLSAELCEVCKPWTFSTVHHCDLFCRLSGPVLLKLRSDLMESLTNSKLNKFSLMTRMTFNGTKLQVSDVLDAAEAANEATALREHFEAFSIRQVTLSPLMAARLYPPGQLLHLHRRADDVYEPRLVEAKEFMERGMMIQSGFFSDHFPDKVAAVLSDLAASGTDATQTISSMRTSSQDSDHSIVDTLVRQSSTRSTREGSLDNV